MAKKLEQKRRRHGVRKDDPVGPLMKKKGVTCPCWNCLRAVGITPKREFVQYHKDIFGNEYRVDNGQVSRPAKQEKHEHKVADRGLKKEAL